MRSVFCWLAAAALAAVAAAIPVSAAQNGAAPAPRFKQGTVAIAQGSRQVILQVEVADTPETRAHGLMFRRKLAERAGMLFVFEETGHWGFWMKNTLIPLSIAFIDEGWRIVDIVDMQVAPDPERGPFEIYQSKKPFRYALEVNQGFFRRAGITAGARVRFSLQAAR